MTGWLVLGGLLLLLAGVIAWRWVTGKRSSRYFAVVEYWIYSNSERLPQTPALMDKVVGRNPHNRPGKPAITQREGILFSDVRFDLGLAKREKNPHAFRPDLFDRRVEPDAKVLEALARAQSITKVKYTSQVPLTDGRHLQFVVHVVDALASMTDAEVVFDTVTDRFWQASDLSRQLSLDNNGERPELHVRVYWSQTIDGCRAESLGLRKVGRSELVTSLQEPDERTLVTQVLQTVAARLFVDRAAALPVETTVHGDTFVVEDAGPDDGRTLVRIVRRQER